jgi:tetratricopeptide (TPR) repeat protein
MSDSFLVRRLLHALLVLFLMPIFVVIGIALEPVALAEDMPGASWQVFEENARKWVAAGDLDQAEASYQQALKIADSQRQIEPGVVNCLVGLSLVYHKRGNVFESERLYELAMRNLEGVYGPTSTNFANWMPDLAWLYDEHGKHDKAEILLKRALAIREQAYGKDDLRVAESLDIYAKFLRQHQRISEAAVLEARAKTIRDKQAP